MIDDAQLARHLLDQGLIGREELRRGRQLQLKEGGTLYDALMAHRIVSESPLLQIVGRALNLPLAHLEGRNIDPQVLGLMSESLARSARVIPIDVTSHHDGGQLLLAMEDPLDLLAMDDVASQVSLNIQPALAGPNELDAALDRYYAIGGAQENVSDFFLQGGRGADPFASQNGERGDSNEPLDDLFSSFHDAPAPAPAPVNPLANANARSGDDSWAAFFDDAQSKQVPTQESAVVSQQMRDRPHSDALDLPEMDDSVDGLYADDPISLLDERVPPRPSNPLVDLDAWDMDLGEEDALHEDAAPSVPDALDGQQEESESDELFDQLLQSMEEQDPQQPFAPSSTYLAGPMRSLSHEMSAPSNVPSRISKATTRPAEPEVNTSEESEIIELNDVLEEPAPADESPSNRTHMGSIQSMFNEPQPTAAVTDDEIALLLLDEGDQEDEGEERSIASSDDAPTVDGATRDQERLLEPPPSSSSTIGRLKLKRIAVPRAQGVIQEVNARADAPKNEATSPGLLADSLFDDEDLLGDLEHAFGSRSSADVDPKPDEPPPQSLAALDPPTREISMVDIEIIHEMSAELDPGPSLDENTAAAQGVMRAKLDSLADMSRHESRAPQKSFARDHQETTNNQSITKEYLRLMRMERAEALAEASSGARDRAENMARIPEELSANALVRALVVLCADRGPRGSGRAHQARRPLQKVIASVSTRRCAWLPA